MTIVENIPGDVGGVICPRAYNNMCNACMAAWIHFSSRKQTVSVGHFV